MLMTEFRHVTDHYCYCHVMYVVGRSFCAFCENRACFYKTGNARIKFKPVENELVPSTKNYKCLEQSEHIFKRIWDYTFLNTGITTG